MVVKAIPADTNRDDFIAELKKAGEKAVLVDFHAVWCGPCKMIAPKLEEWSNKVYTNVVFLKVDVDECEDIAAQYSIEAMPTFVIFKNGEEVDRGVGANPDTLKKLIEKYN